MLRLFEVAEREGCEGHAMLAGRLGLTKNHVYRLSTGSRGKRPTVSLRNAIKAAFPQYDPDWLLGEADPEPEPAAERSA